MKKVLLIGVIFSVTIVLMWGYVATSVEKPKYTVVSKVDVIEIREYQPMIIAKVIMAGEQKAALSSGFRVLADYIFGNNSFNFEIAMTAPVAQQESAKIAMTAPVQQSATSVENREWQVSFVMPAEYTIDSLPRPNNDAVVLEEIPARKYVVIKFSGFNSPSNFATHEAKLLQYMEANNLSPQAAAIYAHYNPPWTLPFLRRNEVMLPLAD